MGAKAFQCPADPLLRGVITDAEGLANRTAIVALEKPEKQRLPVFIAQISHCFVEHGADLVPFERGFGSWIEYSMACLSRNWRRRSSRNWLSAAKRVLRKSQPRREAFSSSVPAIDCALRARSVKTLWAT